MTDRLTLRGALAEKKQKRIDLAAKASRLIRSLDREIQPAAVIPLSELSTRDIRDAALELHEITQAYLKVLADIREIEAELG